MVDLASVSKLRVPTVIVDKTWSALRAYGAKGFEGFVLWLGHMASDVAEIRVALVPPQSSIRGEDGVGYFVNSDTLFHLNRELHRSGLRLIAQVHSHPTEAFHSSTDDAYAIVTTEGGFSIVVPDFAADEPDASACAIYRLRGGRWRELKLGDIDQTIEWGHR